MTPTYNKSLTLLLNLIYSLLIIISSSLILFILVNTSKYEITIRKPEFFDKIISYFYPTQEIFLNTEIFLFLNLIVILLGGLIFGLSSSNVGRLFIGIISAMTIGFLSKICMFFLANKEPFLNFYIFTVKKNFSYQEKVDLFMETYTETLNMIILEKPLLKKYETEIYKFLEIPGQLQMKNFKTANSIREEAMNFCQSIVNQKIDELNAVVLNTNQSKQL